MFDIERDPRSEEAYESLCSSKHCFIGKDDFILNSGEILIGTLPRFYDEVNTEMVKTAINDLNSFLSDAFLLENNPAVNFEITARIKKMKGGNKREHVISVNDNSIEISGASEWGVASGLYHLQRLLKLRCAPAIGKEEISSYTRLDPSLAYLAFKRDTTIDFDYPEAYNENYLLSITRAGYTGFHLNLSTNMFSCSSIYTELNNPDASANFETLRKIISIARKCSLEVFLSYYTVPLPKEHKIFERFPSMRGSRIVTTNSLHPLCTSSPDTLEYYCEHFKNLFCEAKGLAGVFLIVGCEGFLHCFTAPYLDKEQKTTCPECAQKDSSEIIAYLVNKIAKTIKAINPDVLCTIWTYGIHTWAIDKGEKLLSLLSKECEVMTNFDTGDKFQLEGAIGNCFDYSLRCIGPGEMFKKHSEIAKEKSIKILAKSESGSPLEFYNFPTLPANTRWGKKYENILKSNASGSMFNWKFMGFIGEISQELAGWMSWAGYEDYELLLRKIAGRDFGIENTAKVMEAWALFDKAMDFHPFSISTAGYFKGPFYIAFTHPLILDSSKVNDLCDEFWVTGDAGHLGEKFRKPRFVTDLSWVQPFGVDACLRALMKMENLWADACSIIPQNPKTEKHKALAAGMLCMIRTSINTVNFFIARDDIFREKHDMQSFREKL